LQWIQAFSELYLQKDQQIDAIHKWRSNAPVCWLQKAGYEEKIKIAVDPASSEFYKDGKYDPNFKDPDRAGKELISP
jgi:enolase